MPEPSHLLRPPRPGTLIPVALVTRRLRECTYHGRAIRLLPDPVPVTERVQYAQQEQAQEQEPVTIPDKEPAFSKQKRAGAKTAAEQRRRCQDRDTVDAYELMSAC